MRKSRPRPYVISENLPAMTVNKRTPIMDPIRRNILAMGAAATAVAAAPRVFAQQTGPGGAATSFYEKGNVRIRYREAGSGFPLLCTPGGGLNSQIAGWPTAVINAME